MTTRAGVRPARACWRLLAGVCAVAGMLTLCGCAGRDYRAPIRPPLGLIYSRIEAPLTLHYQGTPTGENVRRVSRSNTTYINVPNPFFRRADVTVVWNDVAIAHLAREEGLTEVYYTEYEVMNILIFYARFTVKVYGR